ncbi:hypothetical protein F2P81_018713 [Scophthalmus maximus]|uniref:Uncharacterized protein n=1 Tax=Scophthalmus maximus TaxID=52904 RepID=A0A6A4SBD6_SCOMX|nr:hypothetical protein F2P81_018713 [Scophthalmus maximus]
MGIGFYMVCSALLWQAQECLKQMDLFVVSPIFEKGNNDGVPKYRRRSGRARWPNTAATIGLAVTHASVMTPMTASAGGDETYGGSDGELRPAQVPSLDVTTEDKHGKRLRRPS